ncbi:DUF4124 domain-containing protein [Variovorax sp. J22P168]|uniref:DUF4124 domain-containing protein n=1 Tax=Variovorax jilinensis TaxID=3053513 RepID=UPI00257804BE|nr:DUF4124 domain-containing protein [Variovorax sp. J22P168]MDM0012489.1 DUF4124 domain-containing protein [Variovorax sp. J22P168]
MPDSISRSMRVLVLLSLGVTSLMANAEIRRCKDENGQTVISDRPCGAAFQGQGPQRDASGVAAVDRMAVPDMRVGSARQGSGQYDFIPGRDSRSVQRISDNSATR